MAFTDPPYNVNYGNHGGAAPTNKRTIANDNLGNASSNPSWKRSAGTCWSLPMERSISACLPRNCIPCRKPLSLPEVTGRPSSSGLRTPSPWAAPITRGNMNPFSTAGGKEPNIAGAETATREMSGRWINPPPVLCIPI